MERCKARQPKTDRQCGLWAGHRGPHTVLVPTSSPWFFDGVSDFEESSHYPPQPSQGEREEE